LLARMARNSFGSRDARLSFGRAPPRRAGASRGGNGSRSTPRGCVRDGGGEASASRTPARGAPRLTDYPRTNYPRTRRTQSGLSDPKITLESYACKDSFGKLWLHT